MLSRKAWTCPTFRSRDHIRLDFLSPQTEALSCSGHWLKTWSDGWDGAVWVHGPNCFVSRVHTGGGVVMVCRTSSWHMVDAQPDPIFFFIKGPGLHFLSVMGSIWSQVCPWLPTMICHGRRPICISDNHLGCANSPCKAPVVLWCWPSLQTFVSLFTYINGLQVILYRGYLPASPSHCLPGLHTTLPRLALTSSSALLRSRSEGLPQNLMINTNLQHLSVESLHISLFKMNHVQLSFITVTMWCAAEIYKGEHTHTHKYYITRYKLLMKSIEY